MPLTDAQYAAFIDRLIACREAEDAAKEDTKAVYAELADAGEDKTVAGLVVRQRRMTAKDRVKAELRDAAAEDGHSRYLRGKASHVRAREASIPEHDADGVIIESTAARKDVHPGRSEMVSSSQGDGTSGYQAPPVDTHSETPVSHAPVQPGREEPGTTDGAASAGETAKNIEPEAAMLPQTDMASAPKDPSPEPEAVESSATSSRTGAAAKALGGSGQSTSSAGMEGEADRQPLPIATSVLPPTAGANDDRGGADSSPVSASVVSLHRHNRGVA